LRDSLIELVISICGEPSLTAGYRVSNKALREIAVYLLAEESYDRCLTYLPVGKVLRARLICRQACVLTWRKCHHREWSRELPTRDHLLITYISMFWTP
jgi:hypothetical protein